MTGTLFSPPRYIPVTNAGIPRGGAKLYFYQAGTATPATVYQTSALSAGASHTSPVVASTSGEFAAIYLDPAAGYDYKVVLKTSSDVTVWSEDNVPASDVPNIRATDAEVAAGVTIVDPTKDPGNVLRYGTNTTPGTTDMQPALTAAFAQMVQTGGANVTIPPGTYHCTSQVTLTARANDRCSVYAYGAEITTAGAISGLAVTGGYTTGGVTIFGLQINHRGNADATAGFDLYRTWNARLQDCSVEAHSTSATYACYRLHNETPGTNTTGCFWTLIDHCSTRRRSSGDGTQAPVGIRLQGAANATVIQSCNLSDVGICLHHVPESGYDYIANGLLVSGTSFETYTTAYHLDGNADSDIVACRFVANRFETGTTIFSLTGTTKQPAVPHFVIGSHIITGAGTYLDNANNLYFNSLDPSVTPDGRQSLIYDGEMVLRNIGGTSTDHALALQSLADHGLSIRQAGGTEVATIEVRSGGGASIAGASTGTLYQRGVASISRTTTEAKNLRGTVTLSGGTADVTFSVAEPDTSYFIALGGSAAESFSWASKATGGFTINSSNGSSTAVVNWILIR